MNKLSAKSQDLRDKISLLPDTPGVYIYYNAEGTVIYVGKAKNLKRRVSSYFNREHDILRTNLLVRAIADMNYVVVPTEQDALNLESSLIKQYQPHYNVLLKDDKSYPFIVVTNEHFPRVFVTRQNVKNGSKYFGPYTDSAMARIVVNLLRDIFPLRTCRHAITPEYVAKGRGRLCLEYHLGRCKGCCTGLISQEKYLEYIDTVKRILRGETRQVMDYLKDEMMRLASELKFEEAQVLKEQYKIMERYQAKSVIVSQTIDDIDVFGYDDNDRDFYVNYLHVTAGTVVKSVTLCYKRSLAEPAEELLSLAMSEISNTFGVKFREVVVRTVPDTEFDGVTFTVPQRGDKFHLLEVSEKNARQKRVEVVKIMEKRDPSKRTDRILKQMMTDFRMNVLPQHIECFDNSNIQGTNPVASCVVFRDGKPSKKEYRHFNIKTVVGPDDFASMKEVLTRRYTRLMEEGEELPQLVIVDGGKGQLSAAVEAFDEMGIRGKVSLVGIAKRLEEIYFPGDSFPLYINKNSESLRIVQHLRDEAHRFGITHHRNRRSKSQTISLLDSIDGVGQTTRDKLLRHFRSLKKIREATVEQLAIIIGKAKAEIVYKALSEQ